VIDALGAVSHVHGTAGILSLSTATAAALLLRGRRDPLPCLLLTVPGGLLLNVAVKLAVQRARPSGDHAAQILTSFSFPSGHTMGATVFYGFLVVLLWPGSTSGTRAALVTLAIVMVTLVAASRIALGVHYFSDCVAAVVEGLLWLVVCMLRFPSQAPDGPGPEALAA
jgi:membrane-associated phospholipid phosphatase